MGASSRCWRCRRLYQMLCLSILCTVSTGSITAVSSIRECINDGSGEISQPNGTACNKKLVIALTVQADEGKSQYIEANIRRVHDSTIKKNVQLKTPVRITVVKSPVLINYRLYGVGYVNNNPYEAVVAKKTSRCRDDWFADRYEAACDFQYSNNNDKIFDSQGFCCYCRKNDNIYDRGEGKSCLNNDNLDTAHCLRMDSLYNYVFGLHPPQLQFNITIRIEKVSYSTVDNMNVYETLDTLVLGPTRRIRTSNDATIRGEYIADFHSSDFMPVLLHKYLLIPDTRNVRTFSSSWNSSANTSGLLQSIFNASEWLLIGKERFALSGFHCNKIGVSYSAFKHQTDGCSNVYGSCLQGQPFQYWKSDKEKMKSGRKGQYMIHNFGQIHSVPHSNSQQTDFQLNFIAQRRQRSLITISMQADNLKFIINKSPARIIEAFVQSFEALSTNGLLDVFVQNTGTLTATYEVSIGHCSSGIDWITSQSVTLDPGEQTNVTFVIHSFHALGQINTCEVELLDQTAELMDNLTIVFETRDTCFCYGYCGCSCGNNISECPPPPEYHTPDNFNEINIDLSFGFDDLNIKWLDDFSKWMKSHFGGIILFIIILVVLLILGVVKVLLMVFAGQIVFPAVKVCCSAICTAVTTAVKVCCSAICTGVATCAKTFCSCCCSTVLNVVWGVGVAAKGKDKTKYVGRENMVDRNAKRPVNCDGMCTGAKKARRVHRKKLRMLKRQGAKATKITVWWEKPYTCTCIIKTNQDILEIFKGLFFFIYCPLLPLWWSVEFFFEWIMRRRRRTRRLMEYRKLKEEKQKRKEETYLMVDQYSRGMKEKKDFNSVKSKKKKQKKGGKDKSEDIMISDGESAKELGLDTDTTDTDEAGDIDELLHPDYPIYFNYAGATEDNTPSSLISPGKNFSICGKLTQNGKKGYTFALDVYTVQVKKQVKKKTVKLDMPLQLDQTEFVKNLKANIVQVLVTIKPLFTCLNDKPK